MEANAVRDSKARYRKADGDTNTEHYDYPNAPRPNSMAVAASALVPNKNGHICCNRDATAACGPCQAEAWS